MNEEDVLISPQTTKEAILQLVNELPDDIEMLRNISFAIPALLRSEKYRLAGDIASQIKSLNRAKLLLQQESDLIKNRLGFTQLS